MKSVHRERLDPPVAGRNGETGTGKGLPTLALALLLTVAVPTLAAGQETDPDRPTSQAGQLQAQTPGRVLRAFTTDGRLLTGRFVRASSDAVVLDPEDGGPDPISLDLTSLDRIDARHRSTRRGAWILGASGVLVGGLFGGVANQLCESSCDDDVHVVVTLAAFGGLAGAGLGAIIGAAIPRWQRVWP